VSPDSSNNRLRQPVSYREKEESLIRPPLPSPPPICNYNRSVSLVFLAWSSHCHAIQSTSQTRVRRRRSIG
jgi:hypothetical protein